MEQVKNIVAGACPCTPDDRYFVVRGRLWRCSNPALSDGERKQLTSALMAARRAVGAAQRAGEVEARRAARAAVDAAKHGLGERGPVWWGDGAPDYSRHLVKNTPYAEWHAALTATSGTAAPNAADKADGDKE